MTSFFTLRVFSPHRSAGMILPSRITCGTPSSLALSSAASLRRAGPERHPGLPKIRLGEPPAPVPEPFASLLLSHTGQRLDLTTATNADARWLFPGRRGGQPMDPASIEKRLHLAGIPARNGRTAALRQLVLQAPAPVIADMLSYSHQGTARVAAEAGSPWSRYAPGDNGWPSSGKGDS